MCGKEVNTYSFAFDSAPDWYKTQEMCDRVVYENPFLIVYFPDKYTTQKMCDEAVDDCLAALKLLPDWFVARKMTKKPFTALNADENILYFNKGSGEVAFNCRGMGTISIDLNSVSLDDNFNEDGSGIIILIRFLARHIKFRKRKRT